jgi:hypothetical protein
LPRVAKTPEYTAEILETLRDWASGNAAKARLVERAKIILKSINGQTDASIAQDL